MIEKAVGTNGLANSQLYPYAKKKKIYLYLKKEETKINKVIKMIMMMMMITALNIVGIT